MASTGQADAGNGRPDIPTASGGRLFRGETCWPFVRPAVQAATPMLNSRHNANFGRRYFHCIAACSRIIADTGRIATTEVALLCEFRSYPRAEQIWLPRPADLMVGRREEGDQAVDDGHSAAFPTIPAPPPVNSSLASGCLAANPPVSPSLEGGMVLYRDQMQRHQLVGFAAICQLVALSALS